MFLFIYQVNPITKQKYNKLALVKNHNMKLAILFSGGKDSSLTLYKAKQHHKIACLISILSNNQESYMFHVSNIKFTQLQAKALKIPIIQKTTKGEKEKELKDLKKALSLAKQRFKIQGIATGSIRSVYQTTRVQKICKELNLWCFNPLWLNNPKNLLKELISKKFKVIISSVACEGLTKNLLGKTINKKTLKILTNLSKKFNFNLSFEGGEAETFVIDCPIFKKKIKIIKAIKKWQKDQGFYIIKKAKLIKK